ncbi:uncharacterized protein ACIQIH_008795 isoform 1-T1 [Cyanocitta cristata]
MRPVQNDSRCCWQHPDKISATQKTTYWWPDVGMGCPGMWWSPRPGGVQGRNSAFPFWRGGQCRLRPALRSAGAAGAALPGPGPGLCKEPSYARNADIPLRNLPPLSEPSLFVPAQPVH